MSNGGYLQSDEGSKARQQEIQQLEDHFDEILDQIFNPQPGVDLADNPFMQAGEREVERLKWDLGFKSLPDE